MSKPRLLLADDNVAVAEALRCVVESHCDLVGVVHDGAALLKAARDLRPDVIVTDISMPQMSGLEVARQLQRDGASARIIFLTMYQEEQLVAEAFRIGASAYLMKYSAGEELVRAIHEVVEGPEGTSQASPADRPSCL